jgi:hypothetical protein
LVLLTIASSLGLMVWHVRSLRQCESEALQPADRNFRRRQFRRRMQASAMLGLLGLALMAAPLISHRERPLGFLIYWMAVLAWLGWIVLLALGDAWSSQQHIRRQSRVELDRILHDREEVSRIHLAEQNGHDSGAP